MTHFCMLTLILALSALVVCTAHRRHHHSKTDVLCLNGGTSVTLGRHMFCLCPDGYKGYVCEIDESVSCFNGNGRFYRGSVSKSASGRECLSWNSRRLHEIRRHGRNHGLGRHNSCRNPDHSDKPWCYIQTQFGIMKEDCDIPHCINQGPDVSPDLPSVSDWQCGVKEERIMKVVGGALSTVQRHPWMAAVFVRSKSQVQVFNCGGSLISPCWILTAAHCFHDGSLHKPSHLICLFVQLYVCLHIRVLLCVCSPKTNIHDLSVFLGKNAVNETDLRREQTFRVSELIIHENFNSNDGNQNNDIALLKIQGSDGECAKESSSVKTVCIPDPDLSLDDGTSCDITGYGKEREGSWYYSQYLKEAKVNIISHDLCSSKEYYGNMITDNMLCAASKDWSTDTCKGDSGGPLVCTVDGRAVQFGVVSWGDGCSRKFRPGVYTKVSNYYQWILKKTCLSSFSSASALH